MTVVSIRLNKEEEMLFKDYSEQKGKTLPELFKSALIEEIKDKLDYEIGVRALENIHNDLISTPIAEFIKTLGK
ncbi:translation repressor RelB [Aerococcaceae bacterium DSM 111020]|nr:translation repressor RelB [Aerococcaceae bacterium DSM 111020]